MEPKEVVDAFAGAFNAAKYDDVNGYLSDGFTFSGPTPEPVDAQTWLGLSKALRAGIPDLNFHLHSMSVEGNVVMTGTQLSGTHTADLDLTPLGFGVIPASGKSVELPHEEGKITVEGDKIVSYEIDVVEGGGLMGILAQIGFQPPSD